MRRKDREITDMQEMLSLIEQCEILHLALFDGTKPYVLPLHFGWAWEDERLRVYFHSAREGRKVDIIQAHPGCALTFVASSRVTKAETACGWSADIASVMAEGTVRPVTDEHERIKGLDALMHHYGYQGKPGYAAGSLQSTAVYCIEVERMTGKRKGA